MDNLIQLVLFHTVGAKLDALRRRMPDDAAVTFFEGTAIDANARLHLDALFVTPMMAYEFGIHPPLAAHEAHIFPMPEERRTRGLPRMLIAGVSLVPGRKYSQDYLARVTVEELGRAVSRYNGRRPDAPIKIVGAIPQVLGLEGPGADSAISAVQELLYKRDASFALRTA